MSSTKKPEEKDLFGSWKVLSCESVDGPYECLIGTEFRLDESGDLIWKIPPTVEQDGFPFFLCETFEYVPITCELKCYGTNVQMWMEFKCSLAESGELVLACDSLKLHCTKVEQDATSLPSPPYSLLNALTEGFFTDVTLTTTNGQQFHAHKTVLSCTFTNQDWDIIPPCLKDQCLEVLQGLLHYSYSGSLPGDLSEDTCKQLHNVASQTQGLERLDLLCKEFLEATALKNRITGLLDDLSSTFDHVTNMLALHLGGAGHQDSRADGQIAVDPAKLSQVARSAFREIAVGFLKFILLCEIFTKRKTDLRREERHEVIQYVKSRLPSFSQQLLKLLLVCHDGLSHLSATQQEEVVSYLIPEIEVMWDTCTKFGMDAGTALDHILQRADGEHKKKSHRSSVGTKLGRTLRNALHLREVMTLKRIQRKTTATFVFFLQKREDFSVLPEEGKVRFLIKAARKLLAEIPDYVATLRKVPKAVEEKLTWKDWKHAFKVWTARASWVLGKISHHRETLKPLIETTCHLVNQESFSRTATELGLVETASQEPLVDEAREPKQPGNFPEKERDEYLHCVTTPPAASDSKLAQAVFELLSTGAHTDLNFVLECDMGAEFDTTAHEGKEQVIIKAHRVIVAARCDWFRRALLSGMKESIDRKILVPDTTPDLFRKFLGYLYRGLLDTTSMSVEQLADMMALSDRYETDSLKQICETSLVRQIGEDSALFLLNLGDQYNAPGLKAESLAYVASNPDLMDSEVFDELPTYLQTEVGVQIETNMKRADPVMEDVREAFAMSTFDDSDDSDDSTLEGGIGGNPRVEHCIEVLTNILGDSVPRRELVRVTLAADCDPNRALNFYFAS